MVHLPMATEQVTVLNTTGATLAYAPGEIAVQPADAVVVPAHYNLGLPIRSCQTLTVWWSAPSNLTPAEAAGMILCGDEAVILAGPNMAGGSTQDVQVTNIPNVWISNNTNMDTGVTFANQTSVSTAAVSLSIPTGQKSITILNASTTDTVYLGATAGVTVSDGFPLLPQQTLVFYTYTGATSLVVYAIATTAVTVGILGLS